MRERIAWIDIAKGIAMISVVLCHVVDGLYSANMFQEYSRLLYGIRNFTNVFQMTLFCMISGFLYAYAYGEKGGANKKRAIRYKVINFMLTYIIWCWILGIIKILFSGQVNKNLSVIDLLLVLCKPIGVYWYLYVLSALYILFSFDCWKKYSMKRIFSLFLLVGLVGSYLATQGVMYFEVNRILYYSLIFFVGMLYAIGKYRNILKKIGIGLFLLAILFCIVFWNSEKQIYHIPFVNLISGLGISLFIFVICERVCAHIDFKILSMIGKNSLDIYILHVFITGISRNIINMFKIQNIYVCVTVVTVIAVFVPIALCAMARKMKVYEVFFQPYLFLAPKLLK